MQGVETLDLSQLALTDLVFEGLLQGHASVEGLDFDGTAPLQQSLF